VFTMRNQRRFVLDDAGKHLFCAQECAILCRWERGMPQVFGAKRSSRPASSSLNPVTAMDVGIVNTMWLRQAPCHARTYLSPSETAAYMDSESWFVH